MRKFICFRLYYSRDPQNSIFRILHKIDSFDAPFIFAFLSDFQYEIMKSKKVSFNYIAEMNYCGGLNRKNKNFLYVVIRYDERTLKFLRHNAPNAKMLEVIEDVPLFTKYNNLSDKRVFFRTYLISQLCLNIFFHVKKDNKITIPYGFTGINVLNKILSKSFPKQEVRAFLEAYTGYLFQYLSLPEKQNSKIRTIAQKNFKTVKNTIIDPTFNSLNALIISCGKKHIFRNITLPVKENFNYFHWYFNNLGLDIYTELVFVDIMLSNYGN